MEHTNLFLFENETALISQYPDGKVDDVEPGVAYARPGVVYFNKALTTYTITVHAKDRSGATVTQDWTVQSPSVLEGNTVKLNVAAVDVNGYKPVSPVQKFTVSGDSAVTVVYLHETAYTITVNHMCAGSALTSATSIVVSGIYEDDVVRVKIEPESIPGYIANAVTISVSGDTEYDLIYSEDICYVDLGLPSGTLWACKNLGAVDENDCGNLYAWGEIVPNKDSYTEQNYRFYDSQSGEYTKYTYDDDKWELEPEDDAANVVMGGNWHIPTVAQFNELYDNCTTDYVEDEHQQYVAVTFTSNINGQVLTFAQPADYQTAGDCCSLIWLNEAYSNSHTFAITYGCEFGLSPTSKPKCSAYGIRPVLGNGPQINPAHKCSRKPR